MRVQILPREWVILRGKGRPQYSIGTLCGELCKKTAELIEMLFLIGTHVGPRKHVLGGEHTGATC